MAVLGDKTFCTAPWVTIHVEPNGSASPCCISSAPTPEKAVYGDLNKMSFTDVMNGEGIKRLRKQFINNEKPNACNACWRKEDVHGSYSSLRNNFNRLRFEDRFVTDTHEDGSFDDMKLTYWDFRPSNICNLGCIMCSEQLSSGVWQLQEDLGLPHSTIQKFNGITQERADEIFDIMSAQLKKYHAETQFYFAGGEPLIMPEHLKIIEHLVEHEYYDVYLRYNTNLSTLTYKSTNFIEIWKKFKTVDVSASIDAVGRAGEIQRYGSNWSIIKENIIQLRDAGIHVSFNATTTMLTYPYMLDTIYELEEIFDREHLNKYLQFVPVVGNTPLHFNNTPKKYLDLSILDKMDDLGYNTTNIRSEIILYDEFNSNVKARNDDWKRLNILHNKLKSIKNIDFNEILPWFNNYAASSSINPQ